MPAGPDVWTTGVLVAYVVLVAAVGVLAFAVRDLGRRGGGDARFHDRLAAIERDLGAAARRLEHVAARVDRLAEDGQRGLQRANLVRYDAFKELGGHMSFSLALLDARGDGVVLSALNDRDGARVYAKPIVGGRSTFTLSEEEQRALSQG